MVIEAFCTEGPIYLAGDDTVDEHRGAKVYGKGCHRDAVRSSHKFTAYRWGHKWIVLAILVRVPWSKRPWALPVLVTLYQPEEQNQKAGRRHKTPSELMRQMPAVLVGWFPERKFVFSGDGCYATHDLAQFAKRHHRQLTLVSLVEIRWVFVHDLTGTHRDEYFLQRIFLCRRKRSSKSIPTAGRLRRCSRKCVRIWVWK